MDGSQFDVLTKSLGSRRSVLATLTLLLTGASNAAARKKKRKCPPGTVKKKKGKGKKKKTYCRKIPEDVCQPNCAGKALCALDGCGGRCPCCPPGSHSMACGGTNVNCTTSSGSPNGVCNTKKSGVGYCADGMTFDTDNCKPCTLDTDCQQYCGPQAVCIQCASDCTAASGGTACVGPDSDSCSF